MYPTEPPPVQQRWKKDSKTTAAFHSSRRVKHETKFIVWILLISSFMFLTSFHQMKKMIPYQSHTSDGTDGFLAPKKKPKRKPYPTNNICVDAAGSKHRTLPSNEGPLPVILIAVERSGSTATWETMARLTGDNVAIRPLYLKRIDKRWGKCWPIRTLSSVQENVMKWTDHAGIAGFHW